MKNWIILLFFWLWQFINLFVFTYIGEWHDPEDENGLDKGEMWQPTFEQHFLYYFQMCIYIFISIFILYIYKKNIIAQKRDMGIIFIYYVILFLGILGQIIYANVFVK